jgi:Spy/CpxP family protein refolding chaperone
METLELRQTGERPIAERSYAKSHPYQASSRIIAIKMLAASLLIPRLAFSEDDKMGQMQTPVPMQSPQAGQMNTDAIVGKLAELQNQLRRVETMLQEHRQHPDGMNKQGQGMKGKMIPDSSPAAGKTMEKKGDEPMGGSTPQPAGKDVKQMPMENEKMDMMGMAPTAVMKESALPGFPGASHLYHIGSTGFFLDHSEHITLTTEQQKSLNQMKEDSELAKNTAKRKIDQAEQELWQLTSADQPDEGEIEAKISEIDKLSGDERLAFIRSVGEAAKVLTDEQRKSLIGFAPLAPAPAPISTPAPAPATTTPASSPMPAGGMNDM